LVIYSSINSRNKFVGTFPKTRKKTPDFEITQKNENFHVLRELIFGALRSECCATFGYDRKWFVRDVVRLTVLVD